ncbi:prolyl oligopeptidase family serine peptidase [Mycobacterium yunnanensis]|uniref:Prolyl oligopeptidase family serine peptidase n=1 Tax=Mycobacterium yunnanensis TaxID=368477 RepID=A0A9X2Z0Z5_9MYCO|nr:alpha/beta hydrolase [Mycobacterium yunnanensis]MCV7421006.1 prolyl oligopeptidase family serine peptidase [Mycobacterium yunnanensis]
MTPLSRRRAIAMMGGVTAVVAGCAPRAHGDDDGPMRFDYGPHPSQYAELSRPVGSTSAPVVVVVHGGYWRSSYGAELGRPLAADLVGRGLAALNVEYRRVGDGGGWPQTGQDVAAAVDALAERTTGLDLTRVVGLGHSAGGQLAGWLAARRGGAVVLTGAMLQAGVLDLVRGSAEALGGGAVDDFLGGSPASAPQAYATASPVALVPLGVPTVCVHGTADTLVPINQSERFVAAASAAGDASTLHTFDGDHFDPITVGTRAWDLCVDGLRVLTRS